MRTTVEFVDESGNGERLREVAELLLALQDEGDVDEQLALTHVPGWLRDAFAPERSTQEAEAWLARWRAAPDRLAFERRSGWTAANWFHWFSSRNEFWTFRGVRIDEDGRRLVVYLDHSDDPIPVEALTWLAMVGGFHVESVLSA